MDVLHNPLMGIGKISLSFDCYSGEIITIALSVDQMAAVLLALGLSADEDGRNFDNYDDGYLENIVLPKLSAMTLAEASIRLQIASEEIQELIKEDRLNVQIASDKEELLIDRMSVEEYRRDSPSTGQRSTLEITHSIQTK